MKAISLCVIAIMASFFASCQTFTLKSNDVGGQATKTEEYDGFGCNGKNISPQLYWENAPANTKSFAITIFDPDAPTGSGWWHWLVFDIPANISEIRTGAGDVSKNLAPAGCIQSVTDYGVGGYGGPCPPVGSGKHQYIITVFALDVDKLGLDENAGPARVGFMLNRHVIEKASISMYYER